MTLPPFLRQADQLSEQLTKEQAVAAIHEMARRLPEEQRQNFLDLLTECRNRDPDSSRNKKSVPKDADEESLRAISESISALKRIDEGEVSLDSEFNPEYDDWYSSESEEFLFSDPEDLLQDVKTAITLIHMSVDQEIYSQGFQLAKTLSTIEISVEGEYDDCTGECMEISDLFEYNLLKFSEEKLVRESVFLAYMGNDLNDRPDDMLAIMEDYQYYQVTLDQVLQTGNQELPEFEEFLPIWIETLTTQKGYHIARLLEEAQSMQTDEHTMLETARRHAKVHPELYREILRLGMASHNIDKLPDLVHIGIEALEKIPENYRIRGEIALMTASCNAKEGGPQSSLLEYCWREAFRSDSSVTNFLRICLYDECWKRFSNELRSAYEEAYHKGKGSSPSGSRDNPTTKENVLGENEYCRILFFDQRFDDVIRTGMKTKESLGWTYTFMKEGLASFTLLFYEGSELPKGLSIMLRRLRTSFDFSRKEFMTGMEKKMFFDFPEELISDTGTEEYHAKTEDNSEAEEQREDEFFLKIFLKWKQTVRLSGSWKKQILKGIEKWISLRVEGITGKGRTKYYGECAAFIAAYGEVLESMGDTNARFRLMSSYRRQYPRHRSLIYELRRFEPNI